MAQPTTRDEFKGYCLRALGDGVLQINISDEQTEDRIDEALYLYQQHHMDAVAKTYLKHQITDSTMLLNPINSTFNVNEVINGANSGARGVVTRINVGNANTIGFFTTAGTFLVGESVVGLTSAANGVANTITLGDADNRYIDIPDAVIGVTRVFSPYESLMGPDILFDAQAQYTMSLMANFTSQSIIPYVVGRQYQQLLNDTFRGRPGIRFERHQNRLFVDMMNNAFWIPNLWMIVEGYRVIDPDTYPDVWSDDWLQRYAIALLKKQWGVNLSKYNGVKLPGDVTLDGKSMFDAAVQEIKELKDELQTTYTLPIDFMVG